MKKNIIKTIAMLMLALTAILPLTACSKPTPKPPASAGSILMAFEGEYTEEKHTDAIDTYISGRNPMTITRGTDIAIPTKTGIRGAYIYMIADASDDSATELRLAIDLDVNYEVDKEKNEIRLDTEWWYEDSSWTNVDGLWSFLVCVEYEEGRSEWYYVRVDFIAEIESR